ncbi:MAG: ATP-dependent Clp protease ATP-binding subunit ClpX [Cytophagales bacterium]|nr:ATP-dependent Clp protease ATP-binding subunit ClpX [Cytophagales bacterium]
MTTINRCSFCSIATEDLTSFIYDNKELFICNSCIAGLIKNSNYNTDSAKLFSFNLQKPQEIKTFLDNYVIGQEETKKKLAIAVYNHYKRIQEQLSKKQYNDTEKDIEIEKSNILLIGNTGTGKTYLAKTLAKIINVPFCIADATSLTQAGYVGEDVEMILTRLYQESGENITATERGIVYIDEIDKIGRKGDNPSITRDVSGEGVQQALLKIIEGSKVKISPQGGRKHPEHKMITINTNNILFICGGAFEGIERIIQNRMKKQYLGFTADNNNKYVNKDEVVKNIIPDDLKKFGLIPELIGRLPIISTLDSITKNDLKNILTEPKNSLINQYKRLFSIDHIELSFEEKAIEVIINEAYELQLGARGLRTICEKVLQEYMYNSPSDDTIKNITITSDYVESRLKSQ